MRASTVVPPPGVGSISMRAAHRGSTLPHPGEADHGFARAARKESVAVVFDDEHNRLPRVAPGATLTDARVRMLGDVVQGLLRDAVDARFHFRREPLACRAAAWKLARTPACRDHS